VFQVTVKLCIIGDPHTTKLHSQGNPKKQCVHIEENSTLMEFVLGPRHAGVETVLRAEAALAHKDACARAVHNVTIADTVGVAGGDPKLVAKVSKTSLSGLRISIGV
jgi:hypothetical protein